MDHTSVTSVTEPELVCSCEVQGDVMDLQFLDEERITASFSNGCVAVLKYRPARSLAVIQKWAGLHRFKGGGAAPCTALALLSSTTVVTGGEDGRLTLLKVDEQQPLRTIDNADNATVTSLACTLHSEVLSTSSSGLLKVWDLRKRDSKPARVLSVSDEYLSIQSMDRHPHQPHLVALGCSSGAVCFWDLRQDGHPSSLAQAHQADIWDLKFHRSYPNNLFTCSQDGALWHWDANTNTTQVPPQQRPDSIRQRPGSVRGEPDSSPWLSGAVSHGKVDVRNYLPHNKLSVNALDIESRHLVCGTDSEAICIIPNLVVR